MKKTRSETVTNRIDWIPAVVWFGRRVEYMSQERRKPAKIRLFNAFVRVDTFWKIAKNRDFVVDNTTSGITFYFWDIETRRKYAVCGFVSCGQRVDKTFFWRVFFFEIAKLFDNRKSRQTPKNQGLSAKCTIDKRYRLFAKKRGFSVRIPRVSLLNIAKNLCVSSERVHFVCTLRSEFFFEMFV